MTHLDRESMPGRMGRHLTVQESSRPIVVDIEEFQYSYKCKHCGHEWSEKHVKKRLES